MKLISKNVESIIRILLGLIFIYAGLVKLWQPQDFADSIASYQLLPFSIIDWIAFTLPIFEISCGVFLIGRIQIRPAVLASGLMLLVFTLAYISALVRGFSINCGCFGSDTWLDSIPWFVVPRDLFLLAMAGWLYWRVAYHPRPSAQ